MKQRYFLFLIGLIVIICIITTFTILKTNKQDLSKESLTNQDSNKTNERNGLSYQAFH